MDAIMPSPRGIVQQFDETLHRSRLLRPGSRLLVGVSGGADSVALLRLLVAVNGSRHWGFKLVVGHVNHGTRGKESDKDETFVKRLAKELELTCVSKMLREQIVSKTALKSHADAHPIPGVGPSLASKGPSEATLREARLGALTSMALRKRCDAIVLAHHADDQAETVLMRMLRGTGLHGLSGIAARREMRVAFVRPLLGFTREQLREYLEEIRQPWREDASNAGGDYLRNRIRHEVMPLLTKLQPQVSASLVRLAGHAQEHQELLEQLAATAGVNARLRFVPARSPKLATLQRVALQGQPALVLGELFRQIVQKIGGSLNAVTAERLREAVRIAIGEHGAKTVQIGGGVTMRVVGKSLGFRRELRGKAK